MRAEAARVEEGAVVIVIDRTGIYGGERVCSTLAMSLAAQRRVIVVTYSARPNTATFDGVEHIHIKRMRWKLLGAVHVPIAIRRIIREERPVAVLSFMTLANVLSGLACLGVRVRLVMTEHNIINRIIPRDSLRNRMLRLAVRLVYRRAQIVACVSRDVQQDLVALLRRQHHPPTTVIHNPVDLSRIRAAALDAQEREDARAVIGAKLAVMLVGAMKPVKGHAVALAAIQYLPDHFHLVFVGDGLLRDELKHAASDANLTDRVTFVGAKVNPYAWMAEAAVVIVPSAYEGFGLVVVEAAGLGIPVVATDVPGLREVARKTGVRTVSYADAKALAAAIEDVVASPADLSVDASNFAPDVVVRAYQQALSA